MKNVRTASKVVLLSLSVVSQTGCAALLAQVVKFAAPPAPGISSLRDVEITASIESHLPPAELGTLSQSFFSGWKSGGDMLVLMFTKKGGPGFYRIDGTVTVDGVPAEYVTVGLYSAASSPNPAPRKVEIVTKTGERASFVIEPSPKRVEIVSINGQKDDVALDLTKDVDLELAGTPLPEGTRLKVSLAINQVGVKSFYDVCYLRSKPKVTIPAGCFRNINIKPGGSLLFNYDRSYLTVAVESLETATGVSGAFAAVPYTQAYSDGRFVNVSTPPTLNPGLTVKGTEARLDYEAYKPSAFLSRPSQALTKFGVKSLSIRGTTFHQSSESSTTTNTLNMGGISNTTRTTTIKTTTLQFPEQTNETWDALLEDLYPSFVAVLKSEFGATEIPVDTVTGTAAYQGTVSLAKDDNNTKVNFARSFRQTKVISAFMPVSEGYGANGIDDRIMKESGADALVTLTLDLQISQSADEKVLMMPRLAFEIVGKANGPNTSTKYLTGTVVSQTGVPFTKDITPDQLRAIVRKSDLMAVFGKALKELRAKETANGDYQPVWALQE